MLRGGGASGGACVARGGAGDAAVRGAARGPCRRDEPRALPGARGRVPRRRARVHAEDRADRAEPRQSAERRRLVEVGGCDAGAVRRAAGALRRHARDRGDVRVRPGVEADAFPGLPGAGRAERRIDARGSVSPGDRGSERGRHASGAGSTRARAHDDRRDGLVGVLPDRGRHRRGHQGDGHPLRLPGLGGGLARLLPHRHLRRGPGPPRPAVRAVHEPDARRAAGHRHRRGVGTARGRLRHGALAPR